MQSSSRALPFKQNLAGASPATDARWSNASCCSQGVIRSARCPAKAEARGANPRESASFKAPVPQQPQDEFRKLVIVGASPTRGSIFNGDHDVTRSITPREGVCAGANPVGHPNFNLDYASSRPAVRRIGPADWLVP